MENIKLLITRRHLRTAYKNLTIVGAPCITTDCVVSIAAKELNPDITSTAGGMLFNSVECQVTEYSPELENVMDEFDRSYKNLSLNEMEKLFKEKGYLKTYVLEKSNG